MNMAAASKHSMWTSFGESSNIHWKDDEFQFRSILLGTRHFQHDYGKRSRGIRGPFDRWLVDILRDFKLTRGDFYGSTTDGGADVKRMMRTQWGLQWEWCLPHLTHCVAKAACGLVSSRDRSKNLV